MSRLPLVLAFGLSTLACSGEDPESEPAKPVAQAFMERYFEVFDDKLEAEILDLYAPDVTAEISGLGTLSGRDAVRDGWLVPFRSAFPDYVHTLASLETSGQTVVAEFTFSGTHQGPLLGFEPTGKRLDLPITGTYVISDEQVVDFELEYVVQTVLAAIAP